MYTPWPLYKLVSNKCKGVQTVASIQVISGSLLNSGLRRVQIWHPPDHKWKT